MTNDPTRVMGAGGTTLMGGTAGGDRTMVMGGGATQAMSAQPDAFRTQMGGTTICPVCKSTTSLMDPYCGDCGFLLTSTPAEDTALPEQETPAGELVDVSTAQRYTLRTGTNTVGRQGTDVLLNDGTVSRNHAKITLADGTITIEDLGSSNGTKVGDLRIGPNAPTPATPGTILKFGNVRLTLEINGSAGTAPSTTMGEQTIAIGGEDRTLMGTPENSGATENNNPGSAASTLTPAPALNTQNTTPTPVALLKALEGPGTDVLVTDGTITVGRRAGNTLVLTGDSYISGRHADLTTDNTGTYLTDVGSTNGTLLNGSKIPANEKQMLIEGDEVQIGQTKYRFELLELPAEDEDAAAFMPAPNAPDTYAEGAALEPLPGAPDLPHNSLPPMNSPQGEHITVGFTPDTQDGSDTHDTGAAR